MSVGKLTRLSQIVCRNCLAPVGYDICYKCEEERLIDELLEEMR